MPTFCEAAESSGLLVESVQVQELTYHHVAAMERLQTCGGSFLCQRVKEVGIRSETNRGKRNISLQQDFSQGGL